jgi:hypothetical protein
MGRGRTGDKNENRIFNQKTLAEWRILSGLIVPQFLLDNPCKELRPHYADKTPRKLYKGKYVSYSKVKRTIRLSLYRIQCVCVLLDDVCHRIIV